jgi:hypothetical protein
MLFQTYGCRYLPDNPNLEETPAHGPIDAVSTNVSMSGVEQDKCPELLKHGLQLDRWASTS